MVWREGRCMQRLRPKDAEPPVDHNPAKELQAAPLQVPMSELDFLAIPAGSAVAATTERSPPATGRQAPHKQSGASLLRS